MLEKVIQIFRGKSISILTSDKINANHYTTEISAHNYNAFKFEYKSLNDKTILLSMSVHSVHFFKADYKISISIINKHTHRYTSYVMHANTESVTDPPRPSHSSCLRYSFTNKQILLKLANLEVETIIKLTLIE